MTFPNSEYIRSTNSVVQSLFVVEFWDSHVNVLPDFLREHD